MMYTMEDLEIESPMELIKFLPILIFVAFVAPFLIAAYSVGFGLAQLGWTD